MLLSRVAERVYWQARYLERVENTARLLNVFSTLMLDLPPKTKLGWHSLVEITGSSDAFDEKYKQAQERSVMRFLLAEDNGFSILSMLSMARENARTTREVMPNEAFEQINYLYHYAKEHAVKGEKRGPRHELLEEIITGCQQLSGLMSGTISRDDTYNFLLLGRGIERADMTTRIVDVGSGNLLPGITDEKTENRVAEPYENIMWMNILRSLSAYQMYRQHVQDIVNAEDVVEFLIKDSDFPRAVVYNLNELKTILKQLPNHGKASSQVNKSLRAVRNGEIEKLLEAGLFDYIDVMQLEIASIHQKIASTWFLI
ncbi:MAG: alpha-E domain-containing protein [Pseudohongiellaceae bacterium]